MGPREAVVTKPASGEEVAMALDRDELAARCLVARLTDVEYATEPIDAADAAVAMADALLARLRPEAVAPAPSPAAGLPVEAPAFDEAREREAAKKAYANDESVFVAPHGIVDYIAGWLARARVAAKEPRSGDCRPASGQGGAK